jgi:hypothetical protein
MCGLLFPCEDRLKGRFTWCFRLPIGHFPPTGGKSNKWFGLRADRNDFFLSINGVSLIVVEQSDIIRHKKILDKYITRGNSAWNGAYHLGSSRLNCRRTGIVMGHFVCDWDAKTHRCSNLIGSSKHSPVQLIIDLRQFLEVATPNRTLWYRYVPTYIQLW